MGCSWVMVAKPVGIVGVDDVALVHQAQADAPGKRRHDVAVGQLQPDVLDHALVGLDGALELMHVGVLRVRLLAGDDALGRESRSVSGRRGIFELRGVVCQLSLDLRQLRLERPRVDLGKEVALVDELAFGERDLHQFAIDAAADGDGVVGGDRAEAGEIDGQIAPARRRGDYRHGSSDPFRRGFIGFFGIWFRRRPELPGENTGTRPTRPGENQDPNPPAIFCRR